jgi:hypothetical protein
MKVYLWTIFFAGTLMMVENELILTESRLRKSLCGLNVPAKGPGGREHE